MSMTTLTLWQLAVIFCAYLLVTVGLPAFVFGRKLQGRRAPERFLLYFMAGNFYVMNLVFALQLLKISYPATLVLGTLLPAVAVRLKVDHVPVKEIFQKYVQALRRLSGGQLGLKTAVYRAGAGLRKQLGRFWRWVSFYLFRRFLDCALIALLLVALWYIYGSNLLEYYGYKASDVLVHNYWINALGDNDIFVAGVYPYGFHCVIYYLHAVFGIETFVLLRIFAFVQNVMLHLMLLLVLRLCCRSRYAAYLGTFAFVAGTYFKVHTYSRYYATLPQEFGIIFILPAVYFGFAFFEARRNEVKAEKAKAAAAIDTEKNGDTAGGEAAIGGGYEVSGGDIVRSGDTVNGGAAEETRSKRRSGKGKAAGQKRHKGKKGKEKKPGDPFSPVNLSLAGFCMSFSMTLSVHFYGTMVAGIFCLAMACGYCFLFFRKKYFWKVVSTVTISVVIAVLPMLLAFLGGKPLQGSLGWGMNIIFGSSSSAPQAEGEEEPAEGQPGVSGEENQGTGSGGQEYQDGAEEEVVPAAPSNMKERWEHLKKRLDHVWSEIESRLKNYVFNLTFEDGVHWIMVSFLGLIGLGGFYILIRRTCYGAMLVSTGFFMLFMCVMLSAGIFGLPSLMDGNRGSIYFAYTYPMALAFAADGALYLPFCLLKGKAWRVGRVLLNGLSLLCVAGFLHYTAVTGQLRQPRHTSAQEINEALICLTNIIQDEKDFSWTIVSANDELRMGWDHGYHYETITFLQEMEMAPTDTLIRIPTPIVYFFVEKIPVDYNVSYYGSGQSISEEGASYILPRGNGINVYQGMNRWILMSRMYYWAETFRRLCPNEMEVYMETDSFICYRLEQDPYRLYNLALDYGYNQWGFEAAEAAD